MSRAHHGRTHLHEFNLEEKKQDNENHRSNYEIQMHWGPQLAPLPAECSHSLNQAGEDVLKSGE